MSFDGTKQDAVTRLLIDGRARIERAWWTTANDHSAVEDAKCLMLAVDYGNSSSPITLEAQRRLMAAIGVRSYYEATRWNDALERTKEQVLAAYDAAIEQDFPDAELHVE